MATEREQQLERALYDLVNAKALSGVRAQVAGWNGEHLEQPHASRRPYRLGATLPKTCCGEVYELDEAMQAARVLLLTAPTAA